ncbi:MAG: adenylate/guanylate cyclase domain-containing protein [Rhodospirillaceae bacterium]|nr:adenylate/guanylate cyclase domain-containing protein [Rhodospirillaceae bacterium]
MDMSAHIKTIFEQAERHSELLSAHLRVLVFAVILALVLNISAPGHHHHQSMYALAGGYGLLTLSAEILAFRRFFRPWLPWLFVTIDVLLLLGFLILMSLAMEAPLSAILGIPGSALIFVFIAHAALRHRPWLIAYTVALFSTLWVLLIGLSDIFPVSGGEDLLPAGLQMGTGHHGLASEAVRVAIIILTGIIVVVSVSRARNCLFTSITQTRRSANLARYVPHGMAGELADSGLEAMWQGHRQDAAVLFVDIRGFTAMSEKLEAGAVAALLTDFRGRMSHPIEQHGGVIDKFIGDAIMGVFGTPRPGPDDARNALHCALDMVETLHGWNRERQADGRPAIALGIGVHYGQVFAGAIGNETRLEYTVIGDTVNVAERLEKLTRTVGAPLVVSAGLLHAADDMTDDPRWQALPPQNLPGRTGSVEVFRLNIASLGN